MREVKTVKEKVHQVMNENGQLTNTEEETAQDLDEESEMSRNSVRLVTDEGNVVVVVVVVVEYVVVL